MGVTVGGALGLTDLFGATAGAIGGDVVLGAGSGALLGGVEGGAKGAELGALTGGLTGGAIGGAGALAGPGGALSGVVSPTVAEGVAGAAGGALGGEITGGNPLTGAIGGGIAGTAAGVLGSSAPGAGPSAVGGAPPPGAAPVDLTGIAPDIAAGQGLAPGTVVPANPATGALGGFVAGAPAVPGAVAGVSPEAGFGGINATGIPGDSNAPGLVGQIGQTLGITQPQQGLNPVGGGGIGAGSGGTNSGGILGTVETAFNKNPVGAGLAGAGLLYNLVTGGQNSGTIGEIKGEAQGLSAQGNQLAGYLNSGTLPPTIQASLTSATNSAIAKVKSYYAANGMSGSSSELSAIQQVQMAAVEQTATIGEQLLTQGINEADISAQLLQGVAGVDEKQTAATGSAIASLAAALSGGRGGVSAGGLNINLGGT